MEVGVFSLPNLNQQSLRDTLLKKSGDKLRFDSKLLTHTFTFTQCLHTYHVLNSELTPLTHNVPIKCYHGTTVVVCSFPITAVKIREHVYSTTLHTNLYTNYTYCKSLAAELGYIWKGTL